MLPVMERPCCTDLWQLRSISTASPWVTQPCSTTLFEVEVPLVTNKVKSAPKTRAAYSSASPTTPEWSSSDPSSPTEIDRSERSMFSPKKLWKLRPTGVLRNAVPPVWPGVCHEYSWCSANSTSRPKNGGSSSST